MRESRKIRGKKKEQIEHLKNSKMIDLNPIMSLTASNVNELKH